MLSPFRQELGAQGLNLGQKPVYFSLPRPSLQSAIFNILVGSYHREEKTPGIHKEERTHGGR